MQTDANRLINDLRWDTDFFGVKCGKIVLLSDYSADEWHEVEKESQSYDLVTIENRNSCSANAWHIGMYLPAALVDVNIQFEKRLISVYPASDSLDHVANNFAVDDQILGMSYFHESRFLADPELKKRGGSEVYINWVKNSFGKPDKYFACEYLGSQITGYALHSFDRFYGKCTIELIAVSDKNAGIGQKLFTYVENHAISKGYQKISVGTQIKNTAAINFYHKCGCKQTGCHQIYHYWPKLRLDEK
jgi:dTDP-4-amino-4,6-dideoxy-D-galactose acyltransferase